MDDDDADDEPWQISDSHHSPLCLRLWFRSESTIMIGPVSHAILLAVHVWGVPAWEKADILRGFFEVQFVGYTHGYNHFGGFQSSKIADWWLVNGWWIGISTMSWNQTPLPPTITHHSSASLRWWTSAHLGLTCRHAVGSFINKKQGTARSIKLSIKVVLVKIELTLN